MTALQGHHTIVSCYGIAHSTTLHYPMWQTLLGSCSECFNKTFLLQRFTQYSFNTWCIWWIVLMQKIVQRPSSRHV